MTAPTFSVQQFLTNVGERLVLEFAHASQGTTPTLKGDSREHPARLQLERLLPPAVAVGSGVVIDCRGNASKQQDLVIYDRAVTPIFSINDTSSATYFPVEGVIAVGEIKTTVGKSELEDAFAKVRSVQDLKRCVGPEAAVFRPYGLPNSMHGGPSESYDQENKATDQVFGFLLSRDWESSVDTTINNAISLWKERGAPGLGVVASLEQGIALPVQSNAQVMSIRDADEVYFDADRSTVFPRLVEAVTWMARNGRTVTQRSFGHYFELSDTSGPQSLKRFPL